MSKRCFRASGCIEEPPGAIHALAEVRVLNDPLFHKVNVSAKQLLQGLQQAKELIDNINAAFVELHQEIEIALLRIESPVGARAKEFQSPHLVLPTQLRQCISLSLIWVEVHRVQLLQSHHDRSHRKERGGGRKQREPFNN